MSGYQIEVSLTALCPSCGEALAPGNYLTESRVAGDALQRDNPFERKDRRVFITPCKQCFVHRSEVEASNNVQAAAPELYEECRALYAVMFHQQCPKCGIAWSEDECQEMGARRKAICLCGYEQAIDGAALSKAAGEGV